MLPLRIAVIWLQRRVLFGEGFRSSLRVALALSPTLIFTLVLAAIMRERFEVADVLFGALLLYAALTTLLPSLVLRRPIDVDPLQQAAPAAGPVPAEVDNVRADDAARGDVDAAARPR